MYYTNNSGSYYKKRKNKNVLRIVIAVTAVALIAGGIFAWSRYSGKSDSTATLVQATPSPAPVTAVDLTEPSASPASPADAVVTGAAEVTPMPTFQPDLLKDVRNKDGVKTAYLTFDDGPTNSITPKILDTLRRYNIKATFFQVGTLIESNPDMARRVYEEGHLLANHSYAHNYSELYATKDSFISEIQKTEALIKGVTGEDEIFKLFRYPGGSYNAGTWGANKQIYKNVLAEMGYKYCDWNSLNGDAEGGKKTAPQLVEGVKNSSADKEDIVVLMHDAAAKKTTAEALPEIIEYLLSQGYEFKRLDE